METSTVSTKGQIVVPARIRHRYGIKKGTKIAFIEQNGKLILQPLDKNYSKTWQEFLEPMATFSKD